MTSTNLSPAPILGVLQGFHASAVLNSAIELHLFQALAGTPKTAAQVGKAIGCPERSTAILLDAVAALGCAVRDHKKYRLSPLASQFLVPGANGYVGDAAKIVCDPTLWAAMGHFTQAVKHGGTVMAHHAETPGQKFWDTFANCSAPFALPSAEYLTSLASRFLEERPNAHVLDLACGSGLYGLTLAKKHHSVRLTCLDRASVLATARKNARSMGVDKRVELAVADIFEGDLGGPYDLVIASHVFHHFNVERCATLFRRIGRVTSPGGRLVVHDFIPDESRATNVPAALFAALMLVWTREGATYSFAEYSKLFQKGGFSAPVLHTPPHLTTQFLVGERKKRRSRKA